MSESNLTKRRLVEMVWMGSRFSDLNREDITNVIETAFDLIICHFQNDGTSATFRGFGTFKLRKRRSFTGSDPRTGESLEVPGKLSIGFKPGAEVIRRLNMKGE